MEIISGLATQVPVNLFLMNPCREYWGDILSEREVTRTEKRVGKGTVSREELHLEPGNSLLGSMGTVGRDFFDMITTFDCQELTFFEEPDGDNLLSFLQSDILNLRNRPLQPGVKEIVQSNDRSVQIHSCHSAMREMEVLHDQLLHMFEEDHDLRPVDILVMTPDIEFYWPYIQAVFDMSPGDPKRIPFSIADRSIRKESDIVDTFLGVLDLEGSRFSAAQVMGILESAAVRRRFGLDAPDLDIIRRWLVDTRIRWGMEGSDPSKPGVPPFPENTWQRGLERLLLGYAMPGEGELMFGHLLPYDDLEGADALVLGKLIHFIECLFSIIPRMRRSHTLADWREALTGILEDFFTPDEGSEQEMHALRRALGELERMAESAGFSETMDLRAIKWHLTRLLEGEGFGFGFITGGVTFCAMLPMRSIPFKIICLAGMNGDAYPRQSIPLGFDLIARHPSPGDRSRRRDDRYLFLEALISAREKLYISYVGQSIRDNTTIPPSVLVSELLDYVEQGFSLPGIPIRDHLVTSHRLQAFSPEYFTENQRLFSYSMDHREAAQVLLSDRTPAVPFISSGLSPPPPEMKTVPLEDLCRFFQHPAKFLLERRLSLYLDRGHTILEEDEAFELNSLEKYLLGERLLKWKLTGRDPEDLFPLARASGRLPHGAVGQCLFDALSRDVEAFASKTETYIEETPLEPLQIDRVVTGYRITGRVEGLFSRHLLQYRHARMRSHDLLRLWIHHLLLNSIRESGYPETSMFAALAREREGLQWKAWGFSPLDEADSILGDLLETYWQGLSRPLRFFSKASWEYAFLSQKKNKPHDEALKRARHLWEGSRFMRGEGQDEYYRLCFGDADPLDAEFEAVAIHIFGPLLGHLLEI
jgi:exodeoxyribonuclease V gamma subunit